VAPCGMSASREHGPATGRGAIVLTTPSKTGMATWPRSLEPPAFQLAAECFADGRSAVEWHARRSDRPRTPRSGVSWNAALPTGSVVRSYVSERGQSGRAGETRKSRGAPLVTCGRTGAPGWSIPDRQPAIPSLSTVASPAGLSLSTLALPASTAERRTLAHGHPRPPHRYYGDDGVRRKREDTHQPLRPRSGSLRTSVRPDLPSPVMRPRAMRDGVNPT
jgi:hypothetical protein